MPPSKLYNLASECSAPGARKWRVAIMNDSPDGRVGTRRTQSPEAASAPALPLEPTHFIVLALWLEVVDDGSEISIILDQPISNHSRSIASIPANERT